MFQNKLQRSRECLTFLVPILLRLHCISSNAKLGRGSCLRSQVIRIDKSPDLMRLKMPLTGFVKQNSICSLSRT